MEMIRDASLTRQRLMSQQRRACPDVQRVETIERADTPQECCRLFFAACKRTDAQPVEQRPFMVKVAAVGQHMEGRPGMYDMLYFPATQVTAAVDDRDDRIVGLMREVQQVEGAPAVHGSGSSGCNCAGCAAK